MAPIAPVGAAIANFSAVQLTTNPGAIGFFAHPSILPNGLLANRGDAPLPWG